MKIEFHVHTRYSYDSLLCIHLIGLICKIRHIKCVVICDHNTICGAVNARNVLYHFGIDVVIGEEIFTKSGEIIGIFLNKNIPKNLSTIETVNEIKKQGGLVYIPHPYDEKRCKTVISNDALKEISEFVDFIEIHNGRNILSEYSKKQNEIAQKYFNSKKTAFVCGSDAHTFFELGRNYIITENFNCKNPDLFKDHIISGKIITAQNYFFSHKITRLAKGIKLIIKGDINELFKIVREKCTRRNNKACRNNQK